MSVNKNRIFKSEVAEVNTFGQHLDVSLIKFEPMFFNASFDYAMENGGPITRSFLDALPKHYKKSIVFDSRVHMLMSGWYPSIPGWHHDDIPRKPIPPGQHFLTAGQPDYDNMRYKSEHIIGLLNAEVCPTQFAVGLLEMPEVNDAEIVYGKWHPVVDQLIKNERVELVIAQSNTLYQFDWQTFHQGTAAVKNGWRWFGRVSRNTERVTNLTNEIRCNAQVYLEIPMQGW